MQHKIIFIFFTIFCSSALAQQRDTLKLTITKIDKHTLPDTVYSFYSRVDTIALQPIKTDTSKIVKDVNKQDLTESKYQVKFMGSARINTFYDFAGMPSTEGFMPYDIPVGAQEVPGLASMYIGARQSRFGVEGTANTKVGKIKTYMEVDFASASESYWRLRHAYAEWNYLKMGYTWSTFLDNASLPQTVEFEGPNSSVSKRNGLIRYERKVYDKNIFGISIESPLADYYNPNDTLIKHSSKQRNFDLACRYKLLHTFGHIQVAGIIRQIDFLKSGKMNPLTGLGFLFSTSINITKKHLINAQYSIGNGIAYYFVGFSNRQLDAVYDASSNNMLLKGIRGGFINYSFKYNNSIIFSAIGGKSQMKVESFEPASTFKSSTYYGVNVFYNPIETISIGAEATMGSRENVNKQKGNATRISMLAKFDF